VERRTPGPVRPSPEREVPPAVGPRPVAAQPREQHRRGHAQVGEVEEDDRHRDEHGEHALVADVDEQQRHRETADHERGHDRRPGLPRDPGDRRAEREAVVARHREHHADAGGVHRQRAHGDRQGGVEQEEVAERLAERVLDDEGQPQRADLLRVDVAHGHHERMVNMIKAVKGWYEDVEVIAGNVATSSGCVDLAEAGADAIKVGIGPGAACTTREVTGFGVPQLTALEECVRVKELFPNIKIIADGGIKNSGDIVKALAFGADTVMLGRLLAGAKEAPHPGQYFGNASARIRDYRAPEGVEGQVEVEGFLEDIIKNLTWGIRSGLSYAGVSSIYHLHSKDIEYTIVSPQTMTETRTRI